MTTDAIRAVIQGRQGRRMRWVRGETAAVPWTLRLTATGCAAITLGLLWDISWHASIGRDTVWTPAHVTIYIGALLAGLSGAWGVARATLAKAPTALAAITIWGLHAPLGDWVKVWGSAAMLTAAGFDAWWHQAYGLDLGILTPAHTCLATGMIAVHAGAMLDAAPHATHQQVRRVFVFIAGTLLLLLATLLIEVSYPNRQRGAAFYQLACAAFPAVLVAASRALKDRWAATRTAAVYTGLSLAMLWVLPLFPAQPLLAPILNPVEHMWPGLFPLLLLFPAMAIDLLRKHVALLGAAFLAVLLAVQWPMSGFLLSPGARNAFFAGDQWYFGVTSGQEGIFPRLGDWRYRFWDAPPDAGDLALALLIATLSAAAGHLSGGFLARVRR